MEWFDSKNRDNIELRISEKMIYIGVEFYRYMKELGYLRFGWDGKDLFLQPVGKNQGGRKVTKHTGCDSGWVQCGKKLSKWLKERGLSGKYKLTYDKSNSWYIAKKETPNAQL
jgi:hypothetical protein